MNNTIIETERTFLREYEEADEEELIRIASKKYNTDWLPDWLGCEQWALGWIKNGAKRGYAVDDPMQHFISYALIEKSLEKMIGQIGCGPFQKKEVGVAYFIDEDFKNNGYTTEAFSAFCEYFFNKYRYDHLIATIQPENLSSIAVVKKLKFEYASTIKMKDNGQTEILPFNYYILNNSNS